MTLYWKYASAFVLLLMFIIDAKSDDNIERMSKEEEIKVKSGIEYNKDREMIIQEEQSGNNEIIINQQDNKNNGKELKQHSDEIIFKKDSQLPELSDSIKNTQESDTFNIGIDRLWFEYASLTNSEKTVDNQGYGHIAFGASWAISNAWETKLSGRVDGYTQSGRQDWHDTELDYGESYIRYRGDSSRITIGTQKVIWGRIDEIPPSDRLSTYDLKRFMLDSLADRRRARAMIRTEYYADNSMIDIMLLPVFRESELPDTDSIWYPIDLHRGMILGIEVPDNLSAIISQATIENEAPDTDEGVGIRFSRTEDDFEYAVTVQHGRQTNPYFSYDPYNNRFVAIYPRFNSIAFDFGLDFSGLTWRFETSVQDGVLITKKDFSNEEVKSIEWVTGAEFYPGDGDSRINIQLAGKKLFDLSESILDGKENYLINGSIEVPFDDSRWRVKTRFSFGLKQNDVYVNPEIAYRGWEPHEIYLCGHYFHGDDNTLGGFHEDHSLVSIGWRADF